MSNATASGECVWENEKLGSWYLSFLLRIQFISHCVAKVYMYICMYVMFPSFGSAWFSTTRTHTHTHELLDKRSAFIDRWNNRNDNTKLACSWPFSYDLVYYCSIRPIRLQICTIMWIICHNTRNTETSLIQNPYENQQYEWKTSLLLYSETYYALWFRHFEEV